MSIASDDGETNASHNSETNTVASKAALCGTTHLASGRLCLLPKSHPDGCDFRLESDVEAAVKLRGTNG